jgi:DNA invertase Pin-like site-specific DNA recombinase
MNAIYVRQSVDRADSISIESQIEHCMYEVKKEEYRVFSDKGYSGKDTARPEFQMMMQQIEQGVIKKVVVYKLDRISRSILDFSQMMQSFRKYSVEFVSTNEKFDTSTPIGEAMLNICIVFAQLERQTIQKRVADAYVSRSRAGFNMGGPDPYGFMREPYKINGINTARYIPRDEEVKHMEIIFDMFSKPNTSLGDIVKYFKNNKIKKLRGADWCTARISELIANPIYVKADIDIYNFYASRSAEIINPPSDFIGENGCYLYTKDVKKVITKKDMAQYDNMVVVLAPHKGFIDSETWIKCRLKADENKQIPRTRNSIKTWITGKLKCGKCGYALKYNKWKGKTTENQYYFCSQANYNCDGFGMIRLEILEAEILKQVKTKVKKIGIEQSKPSKSQADINAINIAITSKENEIDELLIKFEGGSEAIMRRLNKKVEEIESEILELRQELVGLEASEINRAQIDAGVISQIFKRWSQVPITEQQAVADILVKKVLVTDKTIEIEWKI